MRTPEKAATVAVGVVFFASGLVISSWASRIPQVRDLLDLSSAALGLAIMCIAIGSLLSLPLSGYFVHRFGPSRVVAMAASVGAIGLVAVAIGVEVHIGLVMAGLFVVGLGIAAWDVAMNVEGAAVERTRGVPLMPRFHAAFSVGTVIGALVGALMNAVGLPVTAHLIGVAVAFLAAVLVSVRHFLPSDDEPTSHGGRALRRAWLEPRTLAIGAFVLMVAFAEGAGMDWIAVTATDTYGASATVASFAFAIFVSGLTIARWFGTDLLERFGRVWTLRGGVVCAMVGALAVVFAPSLAVVLVGALLWGAGVALGFPVGMSAAADDAAMAAPRVSVVSTIGYVAFLAGPTLIGLVGEHSSVVRALLLIPLGLVLAFMLAASTRPLPAATVGASTGAELDI